MTCCRRSGIHTPYRVTERLPPILLLLGISVLGACGNGAPTATSGTATTEPNVGIAGATLPGTPSATIEETDQLTFSPSTVHVRVGQVVEFRNVGSIAHNVMFSDMSLDSPVITAGKEWMVRFTASGTYTFYCGFHGTPDSGMHGSISVS